MVDGMRFWLDRDVDGFRIDVLWHILKAPDFPDNPVNPDYRPDMGEKFAVLQHHSTDQPGIHGIIAEMRALADRYDGGDQRVLIGEVCLPLPRMTAYYGERSDGIHLPFNFELVESAWDARAIARFINAYEAALPPGGWPNWVLGSHDAPRVAGKLGEAQARVAAMLLLTLRGTPTLYQGDEIGIGRVDVAADRLRDPRELREPGLGLGRDPARTPMAWDTSAKGGFTGGEPWLPLHADWPTRNVVAQSADPGSMLNLYRRLLGLRRAHPALATGAYAGVEAEGDLLAYRRIGGGEEWLALLNFGARPQPMPDFAADFAPMLSTLAGDPPTAPTHLRPAEGLLLVRL
jgi:glycosidase